MSIEDHQLLKYWFYHKYHCQPKIFELFPLSFNGIMILLYKNFYTLLVLF